MSIYAAIEVIEQELTSGSLENLAFAHKLAAKEGSRVFAIAVGLCGARKVDWIWSLCHSGRTCGARKVDWIWVKELAAALKEAKAL